MTGQATSSRAPRRLRRALLPLLALLFVATAFQSDAYADPIVLTGGEIVVDRGPRREARVVLTGLNFSVSFTEDLSFPGGSWARGAFVTNTFNCGCDGFGRATFEGFITQNFSGSGTYDGATISGRIFFFTAGFPERPFLFSLDYIGAGFLAVDTPTFTRFVITGGSPAAVPEPATVVLLGSGLAGLAARYRRRRGRRRRGDGESPPA